MHKRPTTSKGLDHYEKPDANYQPDQIIKTTKARTDHNSGFHYKSLGLAAGLTLDLCKSSSVRTICSVLQLIIRCLTIVLLLISMQLS